MTLSGHVVIFVGKLQRQNADVVEYRGWFDVTVTRESTKHPFSF